MGFKYLWMSALVNQGRIRPLANSWMYVGLWTKCIQIDIVKKHVIYLEIQNFNYVWHWSNISLSHNTVNNCLLHLLMKFSFEMWQLIGIDMLLDINICQYTSEFTFYKNFLKHLFYRYIRITWTLRYARRSLQKIQGKKKTSVNALKLFCLLYCLREAAVGKGIA